MGRSALAENLFIRQNFCHHQRSTSADGLSRLDNFWLKRAKLQMHRRQNLSRVKI